MKKLLFKLGPIFCLLLNINIYFRDILADTVASTNEFLTMDGPYFDDISPRNVTAVADDTVVLRCKVKNKGNNTVSWMRKRDLRILTSNLVPRLRSLQRRRETIMSSKFDLKKKV
ncbi:uncharacterized protein LOC119675251 [Teleopsis dalmanni]|uniref:uncharacterized protein LOC119675251 n=1 Tax=Teleopsis dalmanni TaxID=139649 RepID=UPI0018CD907B|nr:uncharacterized protein LOC119675251 [Teleopsis dalmanni]